MLGKDTRPQVSPQQHPRLEPPFLAHVEWQHDAIRP